MLLWPSNIQANWPAWHYWRVCYTDHPISKRTDQRDIIDGYVILTIQYPSELTSITLLTGMLHWPSNIQANWPAWHYWRVCYTDHPLSKRTDQHDIIDGYVTLTIQYPSELTSMTLLTGMLHWPSNIQANWPAWHYWQYVTLTIQYPAWYYWRVCYTDHPLSKRTDQHDIIDGYVTLTIQYPSELTSMTLLTGLLHWPSNIQANWPAWHYWQVCYTGHPISKRTEQHDIIDGYVTLAIQYPIELTSMTLLTGMLHWPSNIQANWPAWHYWQYVTLTIQYPSELTSMTLLTGMLDWPSNISSLL